MKKVTSMSTLLALLATASAKLQGSLTVASSNGNGLQVTTLRVPSGASTQTSYPVDSSLLQSSALSGIGTHIFRLDNSAECVVNLKNSTAISAVIQCEGRAPYDVAYPDDGGCLPAYLLDGLSNGQIFYVGFAGPCIPLRVQVDTSSMPLQVRVSQEYRRDLSGMEVAVCKGENRVQEDTIFYVYLEGDEVVLRSSADGETTYISAADIGSSESSCSTLTSLQPLPTHVTNPGTVGIVVNCADAAGTALRFLVFYSECDEELVRVDAVSEAGGEVRPSDNGAFLAVLLHRDGVHSVLLYDVAKILQTPEVISDEHISIHFLQHGNETVLVIFREGENVELVDVALFTSSVGAEGRVEVPNTTVWSCDPCPYSGMIADDYFMVTVWNPDAFRYDLRYTKMGSDTVSTIPRVASAPPVFLFSRLEPIPDIVGTTTTRGGTATTTAAEVDTTEPATGSVSTGSVPTWGIVLVSVAAVFVVGIIALAVVLYQLFNNNSCWSNFKLQKSTEESPPCSIQVSSASTHSLSSSPPQSVNLSPMMSRYPMRGNP